MRFRARWRRGGDYGRSCGSRSATAVHGSWARPAVTRRWPGPGRRRMGSPMTTDTEIAIVGAGPYGLAVASHLLERGSDVTVLGEPLGYWRRHMPAGMRLRSSWRASSVASPPDRRSVGGLEGAEGAEGGPPLA